MQTKSYYFNLRFQLHPTAIIVEFATISDAYAQWMDHG
jgi:hypothetical protein